MASEETGHPTRRLVAILAADVVGYSRLMAADESGTLTRLKRQLAELIEPLIASHRGRVVKTTGDGLLVEFGSANDALRCAIEWQRRISKCEAAVAEDQRMAFRIGINLGDVIVDGGDVFGDGVNVAARLEALADPGGVVISASLHEQIRGKFDVGFVDGGERSLKNIPRPVRVFAVIIDGGAAASAGPTTASASPLYDRPSIAVLPFTNMSGDPEQEYFADGMVDDIITTLSRFPELFVIARNSSFVYKGRPVDVGQVARELGVRYVLEGSVRKSGSRVRISGQLIDTASRAHLWADRFEGTLEDVFELQDHVAERVVGELLPSILKAEIERAKRKAPASLAAYDCFLRALPLFAAETGEAEAVRLVEEALRLDPKFARAHAMLAHLNEQRYRDRGNENRDDAKAAAERHARAAIAYGWDDGWALAHAGFVLAIPVKDVAASRTALDRAVFLNPNSAVALTFRSIVRATTGDPRGGIEDAEGALRLSPRDPFAYSSEIALSVAYFDLADYRRASLHARRALDLKPDFVPARAALAISALARGDRTEAAAEVKWFEERFAAPPGVVLSGIVDVLPPSPVYDKWQAALREVGQPANQ